MIERNTEPPGPAALTRMRAAGADAFNMGRPNVPGCDPLWHRELYGNQLSNFAKNLARAWRFGWKQQAALVERVTERCEYTFNDDQPPYIRPCRYVPGHDGDCVT